MNGGPGVLPLLMGAAAGGFAMLALRELAGGSVAFSAWVRLAFEPLDRARTEGYMPSSTEHMRLGALAGAVAISTGLLLGGIAVALILAALAPLVAGYLLTRGRRRYRRSVEAAVPDVARAIADCLTAGNSPRGALIAASASLDGPAAVEFTRLRHELDLGRPTHVAVRSLADRFGSERIDGLATALVSQRLAGGDLAALLRRFAEGAAERDRVAEDARSATAQARFTGYLVVAMPGGAALFTELLRPGFLGSLAASTAAVTVLALSVAMQVGGFLAISKLARVGEA